MRVLLGLAVLAVFLAHVLGAPRIGFIDRMENLAYDLRLRAMLPGGQDPRLVIVDIDEKSLEREGRWPWGRDRMSVLLEQLFEHYGVSLVGFDILFAEPDSSSGLEMLERLSRGRLNTSPEFGARVAELRPELDYDGRFARALARYPVVLGYYFNHSDSADEMVSRVGTLPAPAVLRAELQPGGGVDSVEARGYNANLAPFQEAAVRAGHFNPTLDADGVVRRVPLLLEYDGGLYEALSLRMARAMSDADALELVYARDPGGYALLEWLRFGPHRVPVDGAVQALVPYRGPQGAFPYVSATDVLAGEAPADVLRGATVLVGTTAPALFDVRATPVAAAFPGVEIHANLISGMLDGRVLQRPSYTHGAEFVLLALIGLLLALLLPPLGALGATLSTLGAIALWLGGNVYIWQQAGLVLPLASGLLLILSLYVMNMAYGFFVEERGKRRLGGMFGHYVPPELVEEMSHNPRAYSLEAESREMTVLFSDVRGFTTLSEGLNPKALSELMNAFLTPMTRVIHHHRGTIDKYMGDAVMAFWGAPLADPAHARHALAAAMEMIAEVDAVNRDFARRGWPSIKIGVGINTGVMSVGNMGSEFRQAYTVLGDAVNLGSRLEGLTKGYGVLLIVSESTRAAVPDYAYRELDRVRVKGKAQPVSIYEPLCPAAELDAARAEELRRYDEALAHYRAQDWDAAERGFLALAREGTAGRLYTMYAERVAIFRQEPPGSDWDGVFTHQSK